MVMRIVLGCLGTLAVSCFIGAMIGLYLVRQRNRDINQYNKERERHAG